jgi:hypothetical protein
MTDKYSNYLSQAFTIPFQKIELNHTYTSTKETENIIKSSKPENSNGYDEIPVRILKISAPFISSLLTYICNRCLAHLVEIF